MQDLQAEATGTLVCHGVKKKAVLSSTSSTQCLIVRVVRVDGAWHGCIQSAAAEGVSKGLKAFRRRHRENWYGQSQKQQLCDIGFDLMERKSLPEFNICDNGLQ
jgi:hypothetical protein